MDDSNNNNNRKNEYRKTPGGNEFKEKRIEKQDNIRQELKDRYVTEKRQKLIKQQQIEQHENEIIEMNNLKKELDSLYYNIKSQKHNFKMNNNYQRKQALIRIRNLLASSTISNKAIDLLVDYSKPTPINPPLIQLPKSLYQTQQMDMDITTTPAKTTTTTTTATSVKPISKPTTTTNTNLFIEFLIKMLNDPLDDENKIEAAWCITNITSLEHKHTSSVVGSIGYLIKHLSVKNSTLQDQCIWSLGNFSIDCEEYRNTLLQEGILSPAVELLSSTLPTLTISTCFTLSSLLSSNYKFPPDRLSELLRNNKIFELLFDQINFRKNRLIKKLTNDSTNNSSNNNNNNNNSNPLIDVDVEVVYHLLWLVNDLFCQFKVSKSTSIKSVSDISKIILEVIELFVKLSYSQHNCFNESILVSPCIRLFGWMVTEQILFIDLLKSTTFKQLTVIELILSIAKLSQLGPISKECLYFLSNLSVYSNSDNQINLIIVTSNLNIDSLSTVTPTNYTNQDIDLLYEFIHLFSNLYFGQQSGIFFKESILQIHLNVLAILQNQQIETNSNNDKLLTLVCDFLLCYFKRNFEIFKKHQNNNNIFIKNSNYNNNLSYNNFLLFVHSNTKK